MKNFFLLTLLILSLLSCRKPPQQTLPAVVPLPVALENLPLDSTLDFGNGYTLTRISATKVLRTVPLETPRKVKIKNSGNTLIDNSQKKSGNSDAFNSSKKSGNSDAFNDNKKRGQQQNTGNQKIKDVGNTTRKARTSWWLWLVISAGIALLVFLYYWWRRVKALPI